MNINSLSILCLIVLVGTFPSFAQKPFPKNIIAIDGQGRPLDYQGIKSRKYGKEYAFDTQLVALEQEISDLIKEEKIDTLLIYIHGGLTSLKGGLKENKSLLKRLGKDAPKTYPLLINWEAGLGKSYSQHLFRVRQGEWHNFWGYPSSPAILTYDFAREVAKHPVNMYLQVVNDFNSDGPINFRKKNADHIYESVSKDPSSPIRVIRGMDKRSVSQKVLRSSWYTLTSPFRYTVPLFAVNFLGTSSWSNMKRKTSIMFRPQKEFDFRRNNFSYETGLPSTPTGPAYWTFELVSQLKKTNPELVVTLIGHSMGAIVANEAVKTVENLQVDHLVFMGAACSIKDVEHGVIPALESNQVKQFYNLTLNPLAESKETYFGITHAGSLLEWIDNYFEQIDDFQDRTFGKYENMLTAAHLFPENTRSQVVLKSFDFKKDGSVPFKHGQFNDIKKVTYRFWSPTFWQ